MRYPFAVSLLAALQSPGCSLRAIVQLHRGHECGNRLLVRLWIDRRGLQRERGLHGIDAGDSSAARAADRDRQAYGDSIAVSRKDIRVLNALHFHLVDFSGL